MIHIAGIPLAEAVEGLRRRLRPRPAGILLRGALAAAETTRAIRIRVRGIVWPEAAEAWLARILLRHILSRPVCLGWDASRIATMVGIARA